MKKLNSFFSKLCLAILLALPMIFTSCNEDEDLTSTLTNVVIESINEKPEIIQGQALTLTAKYESNITPTIEWKVNGEIKSNDPVFQFSASEPGVYQIILTVATENQKESSTLSVTVYGKYKKGTFVLNEGSNTPGSLIFISPENEIIDNAYFKVNDTHLGDKAQSLFIANNKLYIISQNGGNDGMLIIANAETLKKEMAFSKEELSALNWPTHVAVIDDNIYIRDGKGVYLFNASSKELTFIEGTEGALNNNMVIANGKAFVSNNDRKILVVQNNKVIKSIELTDNATGIIKASDGNIWVSTNGIPAKIAKISSDDYSIIKENELEQYSLSNNWGATPAITAKEDMIYFMDSQLNINCHDFINNTTKKSINVPEYVDNANTYYNNPAINPINGDIYVTTIKGWGTDYTTNNISVFNYEEDNMKLMRNYEDYTAFPAGVFFTYNF